VRKQIGNCLPDLEGRAKGAGQNDIGQPAVVSGFARIGVQALDVLGVFAEKVVASEGKRERRSLIERTEMLLRAEAKPSLADRDLLPRVKLRAPMVPRASCRSGEVRLVTFALSSWWIPKVH